jgi:hypothetical protein
VNIRQHFERFGFVTNPIDKDLIEVQRPGAQRADRLLISPASGRQAGTGLSARTDHWKDTNTRERSPSRIESRTESTDTNLANAAERDTATLTVHECPPWSTSLAP